VQLFAWNIFSIAAREIGIELVVVDKSEQSEHKTHPLQTSDSIAETVASGECHYFVN
jgi:hypothetical protein